MPKKLSERATNLLLLIDHKTEKDWETGTLHRYYVPQSKSELNIPGLPKDASIWVRGAGDAAILKSLERKGLIERPKDCSTPYAYAITEDGRLQVEAILHPPTEE